MTAQVMYAERKSAVLTPSCLACLSHSPTINLTAGCAHACIYCYTRGYSQHPGEGRITLYSNTLEKVRRELPRKRRKPSHVYFSPSSDAFQPVPEVLDTAFDVMKVLLENGVGVGFLTKGLIPERFMELFGANPSLVRAGIGLISPDRETISLFEPNCATPDQRFEQARQLVTMGVPTQMRLDPVIPGVTDDEQTLTELLSRAADIGIRNVVVAALYLRPVITEGLRRNLRGRAALLSRIMRGYDPTRRTRIRAENFTATFLSARERTAIYERTRRIASQHGISVRVCGCKNPDLTNEVCYIDGEWPSEPPRAVQGSMFQQGRT